MNRINNKEPNQQQKTTEQATTHGTPSPTPLIPVNDQQDITLEQAVTQPCKGPSRGVNHIIKRDGQKTQDKDVRPDRLASAINAIGECLKRNVPALRSCRWRPPEWSVWGMRSKCLMYNGPMGEVGWFRVRISRSKCRETQGLEEQELEGTGVGIHA